MNSIDKLSEIFARFPGIGPRQAKRFVYFLLSRNGDYTGELVKAIQNIKKEIIQCGKCMRYTPKMDTNPRLVQSAPMIQETIRCSWLCHEILTLKQWKEAVVIRAITLF